MNLGASIGTTEKSSTLVSLGWDITIIFFWIALFLFIILSILQVFLEKKRKIIENKKLEYINQINLSLFDKSVSIEINNDYEYIALAEAIAEANNFLAKEDRENIHRIIEQTKVDIYLLGKYQKSYFTYQKKFFFSRLIYLLYPPLKSFFLKKTQDKEIFIRRYALYGFSALGNSKMDLEYIADSILNSYKDGLNFQFYEFVFEQILNQVPKKDIEDFVRNIDKYDKFIAKSILCTIGNLKKTGFEKIINNIYNLYKIDDDIIISTIIILSKLNIRSCQIIKENYLSRNDEVRLICSKHSFDICGKDAIDFLYVYFFDDNSEVRKNILSTSKALGLKSTDILSIVDKKAPQMLNDKFIMSMISAW